MTEQDPWTTPPTDSANTGGTAPQYGAPPASLGEAQVPPAHFGSPVSTQKDWMGVTALVLSLATLLTGVTWIGGIIFGHLGLAAAKRGEASNRSMALAGALIGWVFGGLAILAVLGLILLFTTASVSYTSLSSRG